MELLLQILHFQDQKFYKISIKKEKDLSDKVLKFLYQETNQELILIGVGGISSALDVYNKIKLGASLVQMYTSLTYGGPQLINKILIDLVKLIKDDGFTNISEAVGINNK